MFQEDGAVRLALVPLTDDLVANAGLLLEPLQQYWIIRLWFDIPESFPIFNEPKHYTTSYLKY